MPEESLEAIMNRKMGQLITQSILDGHLKVLCERIRKTKEFHRFRENQERVRSDPALWGLIRSYENQRRKVSAPRIHPVEVQRLRFLVEQVTGRPEAVAYYESRKELGRVLRAIHLRITEKIGVRFAVGRVR